MSATRARHLLIDFGEVISLAQPAADLAALAADAGLPAAEFTARYWHHRPGYDRGSSALGYWTAVLGHRPGGAQLRRLVARDVASWLHLDAGTLALLEQVHAAGVPVSLLSNAPGELARELEWHPALRSFAHLLFSADLRLVKPDPAVFTAALGALGAAPADVVFVDDRADNVAAAAALGLRACLFTATAACRAEILAATAGMSQLAA
ncbi:HAD-IA family hydrolase [Couchioplanes caeruleus]|uniref:HAD-IA family hydrolase n=1 Tax=Couchioplanes caeruleus TaxID=56438 RepID=UPI00201C4C3E|nr:HAD-IA family hydrolase [Couchioplanes caeruleus]UQU62012.1 HAD-IA family hydrolase [Couchioplanes caeruleus]